MFSIVSADFVKSSVKSEDYPETDLPEFAFFGRSNAGKSSLINMLLNRKHLVKTGSTPGVTKTINFFSINERAKDFKFYIADIPGYGFAKVKKKDITAFNEMLFNYCINRNNIKIIFLLMDVRRPPDTVEKEILEFFSKHERDYYIVSTKCDKVSKNEQFKHKKELATYFGVSESKIVLTSTLKKTGRDELLSIIKANI